MTQFQHTQRPNPIEDLKKFFRQSNILPRLIIINVGVWMLIQIAIVICLIFDCRLYMDDFLNYLMVPSDPQMVLQRPWTLFTYMFVHVDFFHILFNMLWLFWFGKIFLQYLNSRQFLVTYILGGLAGGGLFILAFNTLPMFANEVSGAKALGASASVMAIVTAISFYVPNYSIRLFFVGNVKIFYLAIALFFLDFMGISKENAGGSIAHIGGALYGLLFIYSLKRGFDFSDIFKKKNLAKKKRPTFTRRQKAKGKSKNARPKTDDDYNKEKAANQKKIDAILDKISRSGYDSLTKQEKELLFNSSNKK